MSLTLQVLHIAECPSLAAMLTRLRQVTELPVTTHEIITWADAAGAGMAGSPTLLVNGTDMFSAGRLTPALACRIYRDEHGHPSPAPSVAQLRVALTAAERATTEPTVIAPDEVATPGEVLSAWRARAVPADPVERAVHQAILRSFASTGHAPAVDELAAVFGCVGGDVLAALHRLDAIRLGTDGHISAAYPFSARPTGHRVRIAARVDVFAMCALDALGIAPMLSQNTYIESVDPTSGRPLNVTTTGECTSWNPIGTVVFLSAAGGAGPSAEACCDHVNFFTDEEAAKTWVAAHPHVPGQILTQHEAQALATRLFAGLLRPQ